MASLVVARYQTVVHGTDNPTLAAAEAPTPSDGDEDEDNEVVYCYEVSLDQV